MEQGSLSSRKIRQLHRSHMRDATLDEVFIVLSVGASLISTLGLLANSTAVVIGAMVVAPWIMPLRAAAFAILLGEVRLLGRSLRTLLAGVLSTTLLSFLLGSVAGLPRFGTEVLTRTEPNLLDLGIALVAGGLATYAKLRDDAVSSLAGTAIAVALVPPVCVMGLLLSHQNWGEASGAGLLFATNLLGILTGGLVLMAWQDSEFRQKLLRSQLSVASFTLTGLLLIPLGGSFIGLLNQANRENRRSMVEQTVRKFLVNETLTFSDPEKVDVERVDIDWRPTKHGKNKEEGIIRVIVRVTDPDLPSYKQVTLVQEEINKLLQSNYQLVVQRTAVDVVGPKKVIPSEQESKETEIEQPSQNNKAETGEPQNKALPQESGDALDER
ncbi:DUF389 domain-containing protein [Synechococcus sp. MIT S9504]|uniref:DUF389 domain-containing protein n=2 Tax=Synechococcus sp. MIT S9504 TaxID=1801628 RepID=UPI0007BAE5E3|nr:DUF389 domain-containing protein [Synechococcus sp. MIT S9504]KZR81076.1 hypothetical protein MITS9504_03522 [Synechococcus sp. MIT S9504]